jgi:hypothetical protein
VEGEVVVVVVVVVVEEEGEVVVVVLRGIVIDGCVAVLLKS